MNAPTAFGNDRPPPGITVLRRLTLRFPVPAVEAEYLQHRDNDKAALVLYTFGIGFLLYLLLLIVEWPRLTGHLPIRDIALLLAAGLPNAIPPIAVRRIPALRRRLHVLTPLIMALNGAEHITAIILAPVYGLHFPYELLTIQLTFLLLLSGVLLRHAVPLAAATVLAYLLAEKLVGQSDALAEHSFVLGADFLLGSIACYLLERSERISWLHARRVSELSIHDQLTRLYNRRHLDDNGPQLLRQARRDRKPTSVLFADIDLFKGYNDSLGHLQGDRALQRVAEALSVIARRPLDLACRIGGEEFVVLLSDCDLKGALERAEELRGRVEALAIPHPKAPLGHVTVSIGVAAAPQSDITLKSLLDAADQALYQAKAGGRNTVRHAPSAPKPELPQAPDPA